MKNKSRTFLWSIKPRTFKKVRDKLIVSTSPHIHNQESVYKIMWMVVVSLIPSGIAGVVIFGLNALWVVILCILSAIVTEGILEKINHKKITIFDGSAFLTGLLLAYNLPPDVPLWIPIIGSFFAIFIGKYVFGGLGNNIFNPALTARAFLTASWPKYMTVFSPAFDAITSATPLSLIKEGKSMASISYLDLFMGNKGGCIGEVCILTLILGAIFLLIKGYISWHTPISCIIIVAVFTFVFGPKGLFSGDWLFHILSGGLILGAFFMATDYVTSPLTKKGQIVFGIGCGLITAIIRLWGGYPEGVSFSILIMNTAVPLIDRYTRTRIYGTGLNNQ